MMTQPTAEAPTPSPNTSTKVVPWYASYSLHMGLAYCLSVCIVLGGLGLVANWVYKDGAEKERKAREERLARQAPLPVIAPIADPALGHLRALAEQSDTVTSGLFGLSEKVQQHEAEEARLRVVAPVSAKTLSHLTALAEQSQSLTVSLTRLLDKLQRQAAGEAPLPTVVAPTAKPAPAVSGACPPPVTPSPAG